MKTNKSWLAVLAAVAALASAQTARAITFGEPDNGRHPNVGAVMLRSPDCLPPQSRAISVRHLDRSKPLPDSRAWDRVTGIWVKEAGV